MSRLTAPSDTIQGVYMEAPSVSGGKAWYGFATNKNEIHVRFGIIGQCNQTSAKHGSLKDFTKIVLEKQNKGYKLIDGWYAQN